MLSLLICRCHVVMLDSVHICPPSLLTQQVDTLHTPLRHDLPYVRSA